MMFNKRLIAMVPQAMGLIQKKVLTNWISLLTAIIFWFSVAEILETAMREDAISMLPFVVCLIGILVRYALTGLAAKLTHQVNAAVKTCLRDKIYSKLCRLGPSYTDHCPTAEVVQLAGEGVEQMETYFGGYLPQFFYAMLAPLTLLLVFLPLSPQTGIALFLCVPLIPIAIRIVQKIAKRLLGKYWDAYANLGDSFLENMQGLTTLKVYGADEQRHKVMNENAEDFRKITMKVLTIQLNSITMMDLVAYGGTALGGILTGRAFLLGQVAMGQAVAMILLSSEFFLAMRALGSLFHVAMNGMSAADRMFRLFDLPETEDGTQRVEAGGITVRDVSFSYDGKKETLSSINLSIPQGSFVSLCGVSGCGKSTLSALISGMRPGYEGSIMIGSVELRNAAGESIRELITVVSSNSYLFGGSVGQTLREGKADATDEELKDVLRRVNLLDFVNGQGGLSMKLSERAANLSGGQRQRLAMARALLKDSPIYIFDEATSNIDVESEEAIMGVIHSLKGSHTILFISHRLANAVESDYIAFLQQGVLAEQGTHAELMQKRGAYFHLFEAQEKLMHLGKEGETLCEEAG